MVLDVDNAKGELVRDPYQAKRRYLEWDKTIPSISKENESAIVSYLDDMRFGINLGPHAKRGKRGYRRLITQRDRLKRICELLERHQKVFSIKPRTKKGLDDLEAALTRLFADMDDGVVLKMNGNRFMSVNDHIKCFKAFWHWNMTRTYRQQGEMLTDITTYLTAKKSRKPEFVYFGRGNGDEVEKGFQKLYERANHRYRPIMAFMFDSGIRSPSELVNVKRKDIREVAGSPYFELTIREETAKTFGRRIMLMFCHDILRRYLEENPFGPEDFVFSITPKNFNQYLKRLGQAALRIPNLTMYDFRHNSVCYYLPRYKNRSALIYRYGWSNEKMIPYYTEFLGMRDTITEEDMVVGEFKSKLEKKLEVEQQTRLGLEEELQAMRLKLDGINNFMNRLVEDPKVLSMLASTARQKKISTSILA